MTVDHLAAFDPEGEVPAKEAPSAVQIVEVETRFGRLLFGPNAILTMPAGPLGFADCHQFGLCNVPGAADARFKLLQCLDDRDLSFIVMPLLQPEDHLQQSDIDDLCQSIDTDFADAAFLLIVTLRPGPEGMSFTVNLRAPIIIDCKRAVARQAVLNDSRYPIRQAI